MILEVSRKLPGEVSFGAWHRSAFNDTTRSPVKPALVTLLETNKLVVLHNEDGTVLRYRKEVP